MAFTYTNHLGNSHLHNNYINITDNTINTNGGVSRSIYVIPDDGYEILTAPTCQYTNSRGYTVTVTGNKQNDGSWLLSSIEFQDGYTNYIFTANPTQKASSTINLTINQTNCVVSPTSVNKSGTTAITVTANEGYIFNTAPTIKYSDPFGESATYNFTLSGDNKTATYSFNASNADTTSPITVTGNAVQEPTPPKTYDIDVSGVTNATVEPTSFTEGETVNITITANDGYIFNTAPTIKYSDPLGESVTYNFTLSGDSASGTYTLNTSEIDVTTNVVVSGTAELKPTPPKTFNFDVSGVTNASAEPTSFTIGETVTITITANEGYNFSSTLPYIEFYDQGYSRTQNNFILNDDKTIATYSFDSMIAITDDPETYPIKLIALANVIAKLTNLFTPYIVTDDDLSVIAQHRFGDTGLSNYINDVYLIPVDLDDTNRQSMYLYNTKLLDDVGVVKDRLVTYIMGTFTLPRKYDNANDYNNSYYITLPYYGVYELDKEKFMDSMIECSALIDVIQGTCTYLFRRDDQVIESVQTTIKIGLPYLTANEARISGFTAITRFEVNPTLKCYCHEIPVTTTKNDYNAKLEEITGYIEGSMIYIEVSEHYKEMINSELSKGVYVNGI